MQNWLMFDFFKKISTFMTVTVRDQLDDISLLALRLMFGFSMLWVHGRMKLMNYESLQTSFPDPLGLGDPRISLVLALFAEVLCAAAVTLGFMTRAFVIPLIVTMAVAFFVIHASDPFERKELALCYLTGYVILFLRGSGKISIDGLLNKA